MPYPAQIDPQRIVEVASDMLEQDDEAQITLARLAAALGVRAPSLYRYFDNRNDLLRAVNTDTLQRLFDAIQPALETSSTVNTITDLLRVADAYRAFALANPHAYQLAMASAVDEQRPDEDVLARLVLPLQASVATLSGEQNSLSALRGVFALVHGFIMLELTRQLCCAGDLGEAFQESLCAYLRGCQPHMPDPSQETLK